MVTYGMAMRNRGAEMTNDEIPKNEGGAILCVSVTPALQRTLRFQHLRAGEVNRAVHVSLAAAGKATNVARVLHRLGAKVELIGFAGGAPGDEYQRTVGAEGLPFTGVPVGAETRICQTLIDECSGEVTELVEESATPTKGEWLALETELRERLPHAQRLLLSGKLPPGSPDDVYARWAGMARELGVPVCVDSQGGPLLEVVKACPELIKINAEELASTFPPGDDGPQGLQQGLDELRSAGAEWVLITRGHRPALMVGEEGSFRFSIPDLEIVNPIGSGDSTLAGIACALGAGWSMAESARFGLACGSANVLSDSPGVVDPQDVSRLMMQIEMEKVGI